VGTVAVRTGGPQAPISADVVIVGGGPAGSTAALYAARADLQVVVVDRGLDAGALGQTGIVANFPGLPPMPGPEIVRALRQQAERFGARFLTGQALGLQPREGGFSVLTSLGELRARGVIAATGATGRAPAVPGEAELLGRGVSSCATCDGPFFRGRRVAVVGRTEEAAEEALLLAHLAEAVELVVPGDLPVGPHWQALVVHPRVRPHPRHSLKAILGDGAGVRAVRLRGPGGERELPVHGVFLYLQGRRPVTDWLQPVLAPGPDGCLAVGPGYGTAVPGVFAVGDVLCTEVKQAVIAAAQGAEAAIQAERWLRGRSGPRPDWR
jgi:thioredoxin reductase (NADPH)